MNKLFFVLTITTVSCFANDYQNESSFAIEALESRSIGIPPETHSNYRISDLGTLGTDESEAIAINENNQVFGRLFDNGLHQFFLWNENGGLRIIDIPYHDYAHDSYFLNDSGQLAGDYYNLSYKSRRSFFWDDKNGLIDIGTLGGIGTITKGFNNNGEIVGTSFINGKDMHPFHWYQGKMTDLTDIFNEQLIGSWKNLTPVAINNQGDIAFIAANGNVKKSFLYCDGQFSMILPEKSPETTVRVLALDDSKNMILMVDGNNEEKHFFFNPSKGELTYFANPGYDHNADYCIVNGKPIFKGSLPGQLKQKANGEYYYSNGVEIIKLLIEERPFFDVKNSNTTRIKYQNSKGIAVGQIDTIYAGKHAFIAVPENQLEAD